MKYQRGDIVSNNIGMKYVILSETSRRYQVIYLSSYDDFYNNTDEYFLSFGKRYLHRHTKLYSDILRGAW